MCEDHKNHPNHLPQLPSRAPAEILFNFGMGDVATNYTGDRTAGNAAFVDAVARKNVELTMGNIRKNSPVIADLENAGAVRIAGAFYGIKTGAVEFFA